MLNQKEKKQLRYPGLKAGLVYGVLMFFGMPLLNVLTDDNKNYLSYLFNLRPFHINSFRSFPFRINDATCRLASHSKSQRRSKTTIRRNHMKSLQTLILSHILVSIFMTFFLVYGYITRPFLIIFLLALPVLNKGQRFQKITSKKIRLLNASLCFILVSLPQLITNSMDWRYLLFLTICIIFSLVYFYTLYQLFKEVNQKQGY